MTDEKAGTNPASNSLYINEGKNGHFIIKRY